MVADRSLHLASRTGMFNGIPLDQYRELWVFRNVIPYWCAIVPGEYNLTYYVVIDGKKYYTNSFHIKLKNKQELFESFFYCILIHFK